MKIDSQNYTPDAFCDWLREILNAKTDREVCDLLEITPPQLSKIRHRVNPIGSIVLVAVHELTGLSTKEIKRKMYAQEN